jgi:N-acetylglucosamine kinase-like BadF-type ATPase
MIRYFLGVGVGSTKSHALIGDENGRVTGFGHSGPGNWEERLCWSDLRTN